MSEEITQSIGTVEKFGYMLEDGFNVLDARIFLGGAQDLDGNLVEIVSPNAHCPEDPDIYRVTSAWEEDGLVIVNATIWDNSASAILTSGE